MTIQVDGSVVPSVPLNGPRFLAWLGILAPVLYIVAVALGGWLSAGYSHYGETVSTLTSRGAPNQEFLVPLFAAYNLFLLAFAFGLESGIAARRYGSIGPALLGAAGVDGLVLFLFPQEPWGAPQFTPTGSGHIVLAGLGALFFLLALAFLWRRLRTDPRWAGFDRFTFAVLVLGILVGGFAAASVTAPWAGLAERLSIGLFLVWTEVMAVALLLRNPARHLSTLPERFEGTVHA